eukprot:14642512-Ditylum_brightwellii.AAC.1
MRAQYETTSLSPSGQNYEHYETVLKNDNKCLVHAQMMSMPYMLGFTPSRKEKSIDCVLEKDPGYPKSERLCIIVVVEGDTNGSLKIIWNHQLVPIAEKTNFISPVQFGNRQGNMALDVLLLKIVTMECICLFRLNGTILNNNTEACYDCTIPELAAIYLKAFGLPDNAVKTSILLNHNTKHYVKTST